MDTDHGDWYKWGHKRGSCRLSSIQSGQSIPGRHKIYQRRLDEYPSFSEEMALMENYNDIIESIDREATDMK